MPGFTAINSSPAGRQPSVVSNETANGNPKDGQPKARRRQPAKKITAVSNEPSQTFDNVIAGSTARKRSNGEGRKRKAASIENTEPKRRKNGSVQTSMSNTKPGVSAISTPATDPRDTPREAANSSTDIGGVSSASKSKLDSFHYNAIQASTGVANRSDWPQPLPYTTQTPTSISQQSQLQTTMQVVRNSSRGASLLYSSSATLSKPDATTRSLKQSFSSTTLPKSTVANLTASSLPPVQPPTPVNSDPPMGLAKIASQNDSDQIAKGSKDHIELPPSPRSHQSAKNTPSSSQQGRLIRQHPGIDSLDFGTHFDEDDEELIEIAKRIEENFTKHQKPPPISRHSHSEPHEMYRDVENGYFDEFIGGEDEELINELAKTIDQSNKSKKFPPPRDWKLNMREVQENEDYGGALLTEDERTLLATLKQPHPTPKPIARAPFPSPILDRTSLLGVSNTTVLRTCFRIGEAFNTGKQAVRSNQNAILELYARITSSWREPKPSRKQHFIIHDLYHDRPPFLNGTFELWDQSALWEQDSRPFLSARGSGMLCRMIARMKRDGTKWRLEILSIWQADWDDVEHVAGIYTKPPVGDVS